MSLKQDNEYILMPEAGKQQTIQEKMRHGFIEKVYHIVATQLLVTTFICGLAIIWKAFSQFQQDNWWLMIIMIIITIALPCAAICCDNLLRKVPDNYIFLGVFTLCESYIVSFLCGIVNPHVVFMAAFMTFAMAIALSLYAMTTKSDFTMSGGTLFILTTALLMFGIFFLFTRNTILDILFSVLWIILLGYYLIYDTQLIIGNKSREFTEDDYILASFCLYIDIITIFVELLKVLSIISDR